MCIRDSNFPIFIKDAEADLMVEKVSSGKFSIDSTIRLPANSTLYLPLTVEFQNSVLINSAFKILAGDSIPYALKGRLKAGKGSTFLPFPFDVEGFFSSRHIK